ncbi:aldo/keto reductase [Brachybacterium sp. AOP43-C2-M15]|uniref:aldo/keto reductase n=1 Tax=Brachybacterium sp. AOP43-C2-M15 TaxID=3457661 RepID=UPI00403364E2
MARIDAPAPTLPTSPALPALGAMHLGTRIDERDSFALLDRFVELGGRWLDTADNYYFAQDPSGLGGQSEAMIGRWLRANPGAPVSLSTKVGAEPNRPGGFPDDLEGLAPDVVRTALERSLERLGVESVDLYWAHIEDHDEPFDRVVETFGGLVADGRIGAWGLSNHPSWRMAQARLLAEHAGLAVPSEYQQRYTYLQPAPGAEVEGQPVALGVLSADGVDLLRRTPELTGWVYTPLLRGAYDREDRPVSPEYLHPGNERRLAALGEVAAARGLSRGQIALAWLSGGVPALVPIIGGSRVEQLEQAWTGATTVLTAEERARLDAAA